MTTQTLQGYPVVIIGAGRGGSALLEIFLDDKLVNVMAVADIDPDAPGMLLAREHGIPTFADAIDALQACRDHPDCIVYNLSYDDSITGEVRKVFGDKRVASGPEVKLFWQMITNQKEIKEELEQSQHQLQSIIHNVMDGIITINESGEIQGFNPAAERIFGYSQQEVLGRNVTLLMPEPDRSRHTSYIARYLQTGQSRILGVRSREVTAIRKSGKQFPMELSISEMLLGGMRYFIGVVRDITERKLVEQKLAYFAHHDYLTGLPNRVLFLNSLGHSVLLAKRNRYQIAVLFLDLDGFKQINDTLGHDAGDLLLQEASKRLKGIIRASDTVARLGGDEFIFVLNNIGSTENISPMAAKIISSLSEPFEINGHQCRIGGSIGISTYPEDSEDIEKLIIQADTAMYLAKQGGKNTFRFFRDIPRDPPESP